MKREVRKDFMKKTKIELGLKKKNAVERTAVCLLS